MNHFSDGVKQAEYDAHNGYCRIENCGQKIDDYHHRFPNTKVNQKLFPLFLQSIFNCAGICRHHHQRHTMVPGLKITEAETRIYEEYLRCLMRKRV